MNKNKLKGNKSRERILEFIKKRVEPVAPLSLQDIADEVKLSKTATYHHLRLMQAEGLIEISGHRNIKVLE